MCSSGVPLTSLIYNRFLDACVQCGVFDRATAQFAEMKRLDVMDTVGYNTMLKGPPLPWQGRGGA